LYPAAEAPPPGSCNLIIYADLAVADIARAFQEENLAENIAEMLPWKG
jgi:hypothetical protein